MRIALLCVLFPMAALAQVCRADDECADQHLCTAKPQLQLTCHRRCQLGCGATERCTVLRPPDDQRWPKTRRRYVCTEETTRLCRPCEADADCEGFLDRCLFQVNGEKACGRDCSWDDQCPKGYRCADPGGVDGREVRRQCIPEAGCCACDQGFFVPAERPPELPAAGAARSTGGASLPAPAPSAAWPTTRPGAPPHVTRQPGWRSPTAGAPSMVPVHSPVPPRGSPGATGAGLPMPAPSVGVTPRPAPTSRHTGSGPLPAPSPSGTGSSTSPRPAPSPVGKSVVR